MARPTGPFLQGCGCGDDQHADASGNVGAVSDVAGAGQAQVTLGFDLAVSVFRHHGRGNPLSFARVLDAERALTGDRRREAPGLPSRGTRNGGGPDSGGWHTRYGCIAGS